MQLTDRQVTAIGWVGTLFALSMYFSFIDQIRLNLQGQKGSWLIPLVTVFSAITWAAYGFFKQPRDWPILACNAPGIPLALITLLTALFW